MQPTQTSALCWFRRDLRLYDHAALYSALRSGAIVHCVFVFDTDILGRLPDPADRRVEFIWHAVAELKSELEARGSTLHVLHGSARVLIPTLARKLGVTAVYCARDYEPAARERDEAVARTLAETGVAFHACKDHVLFEQDEILTQQGKPFTVFTPYKSAWLKRVDDFFLRAYPVEKYLGSLARLSAAPMPDLGQLGFRVTNLCELHMPCGVTGAQALFEDFQARITDYQEARNYPAVKGVSYLSAHLRFGTISVRRLARFAYYEGGAGAETFLSELIWRDFYFMQLHFHPHTVDEAFKPQYADLGWENDPEKFSAWCQGKTGYPLVDAAMRQLNYSGYMHNRLRMVVASFLTKDLHIDWRKGERYFADQLLDFDLAANVGGWQWAASTGCDAQPWFRIFNPVTQSEKFDPSGKFIRRYLPELANCPDQYIHAPWTMPATIQSVRKVVIGRDYPAPIVEHAHAREITLQMYKRDCGR